MTSATRRFPALGTTAEVLVATPRRLAAATALLREELDAIDRVCSRFRADSEISRLHESAGQQVRVSPLLADALAVALRAALLSGGLVDPTIGAAVCALGYDRDFAAVTDGDVSPAIPAPGWHRLLFDPSWSVVVLPRGIRLDLGATAKALAADRAARRIHTTLDCGVLVNLGGDVRAEGPSPDGGWRIVIGDDHNDAVVDPAATVTLMAGGLATSGIARRRWRRGGRTVHHIVDPRTGDVPSPRWRAVSVAARSTVDANTASTAAVVLGLGALAWLEENRLPARLVSIDGDVVITPGWPVERRAA